MKNVDIVVYVLESTVLSGGIKNVLEQASRLTERGHEVHVFALGEKPDWISLNANFRRFANYSQMLRILKTLDAFKIATWWNTAAVVMNSCDPRQGGCGIPLYLVQDIEESYYSGHPEMQERVKLTYGFPMHLLTIAEWTEKQLAGRFGRQASNVSIAVDLELFKPNRTDNYDPHRIVACNRGSQPLKGYSITEQAVREVHRLIPQSSFVTYGVEDRLIADIPHRHLFKPDDQAVASLFADCGVFVQTSYHEGFGLPILEAMACGAPVVTTKAEGNEEFCRHGWNCFLADKGDTEQVTRGIVRVLSDRAFAEEIARNGRATALKYNWENVLQKLDAVFSETTSREGTGGTGESEWR
ncbi:glycosyltransferase family 4 protein [Paenibacillus tarimensis]